MTAGIEWLHRDTGLQLRIPGPRTPPRERGSPRRHPVSPDPVARARLAGVTAAWTGRYGGTVELARLDGPHSAALSEAEATQFRLHGRAPHHLDDPAVRVAVYEYVFAHGTQFDFYRWINLRDLADVWAALDIPRGLAHEWAHVLRAAGLRPRD